MGIGSAIRAGMIYAIKNNYYALITMDADLSHQPKEIPSLIKKIQNHDFVTGSRYMIGGKSNYKGYRAFISRLANKSCRILLKLPLKNTDQIKLLSQQIHQKVKLNLKDGHKKLNQHLKI